ncbi:N-acetyltransferase [Pseudomonas sp. B35(2017)]|uniref:GNAT family N-acetyltransferase n=1 Tax=Pseudomonas sp. B35(2017) TaxID=1981722 RepID=UPI000A1E660C|nr:GNAT family N-acetyltransferase [Pseudomonas sp. B35(2017)]
MTEELKEKDIFLYRPMRDNEYNSWENLSVDDYAQDLMASHLYSQTKARSEAFRTYRVALPQGMNTKNNHFRVYETGGQVAGYIWFSVDNDSAFLSDIILLPEFQGKGIGKSFICELVNELGALKISELELRVSPDNHRAMNLYRKLGFRITGFDMSLLLDTEAPCG